MYALYLHHPDQPARKVATSYAIADARAIAASLLAQGTGQQVIIRDRRYRFIEGYRQRGSLIIAETM